MTTGFNGKTLKKREFIESRNLAQGFAKKVFAHKASIGESSINLGSLVVPPEMAALGHVNPSPATLTAARIFQYKDNLTLISSLRGLLIQGLSYTVQSGSLIALQFETEEGEIITGILDANPVSGIQVIGAKQPQVEDDLADGLTDFAIGFSTRTAVNEIVVTRNGLVQKRNSNNSSTVFDGNYHVVDTGSGFGSVIRFNVAAAGQDDAISVLSIGGTVESPTNSTWDELEKQQGQLDALIDAVAEGFDLPTTQFQAAPNNLDLKQFGDRVIGLEQPGAAGTPKLATVTDAGAVQKNKIQRKFLSADFTTDASDIGDLQFNNLVVGRRYRISGQVEIAIDATDANVVIRFGSASGGGGTQYGKMVSNGDSTLSDPVNSPNITFVATSTTLYARTASLTGTSAIVGDGTTQETFLDIEELNNYEETTDFT